MPKRTRAAPTKVTLAQHVAQMMFTPSLLHEETTSETKTASGDDVVVMSSCVMVTGTNPVLLGQAAASVFGQAAQPDRVMTVVLLRLVADDLGPQRRPVVLPTATFRDARAAFLLAGGRERWFDRVLVRDVRLDAQRFAETAFQNWRRLREYTYHGEPLVLELLETSRCLPRWDVLASDLLLAEQQQPCEPPHIPVFSHACAPPPDLHRPSFPVLVPAAGPTPTPPRSRRQRRKRKRRPPPQQQVPPPQELVLRLQPFAEHVLPLTRPTATPFWLPDVSVSSTLLDTVHYSPQDTPLHVRARMPAHVQCFVPHTPLAVAATSTATSPPSATARARLTVAQCMDLLSHPGVRDLFGYTMVQEPAANDTQNTVVGFINMLHEGGLTGRCLSSSGSGGNPDHAGRDLHVRFGSVAQHRAFVQQHGLHKRP